MCSKGCPDGNFGWRFRWKPHNPVKDSGGPIEQLRQGVPCLGKTLHVVETWPVCSDHWGHRLSEHMNGFQTRGVCNHSTAYTHVHRGSAINGDPKVGAMRYATRLGVNNE